MQLDKYGYQSSLDLLLETRVETLMPRCSKLKYFPHYFDVAMQLVCSCSLSEVFDQRGDNSQLCKIDGVLFFACAQFLILFGELTAKPCS